MDNVISADSEADQLNVLAPNIAVVKDSASGIVIRANRTMDQLNSQIDQLDKSFLQLSQLRDDANDLIDVSKWVIKRVEMLKDSFANNLPVENREQLISDSERLLKQIKDNEKEYVNYKIITLFLNKNFKKFKLLFLCLFCKEM